MVKNLGSYITESIKYKKDVTDNIQVQLVASGAFVKLNDPTVIKQINDKVESLVVQLNRNKPIENFTNKL